MTCQCGKTALYRVGTLGFCRAHYGDAVAVRRSVERKYSETEPAYFADRGAWAADKDRRWRSRRKRN